MAGSYLRTHTRSRTVPPVARPPRKNRNLRVEDALWDPAMEIAEARGEVLSEVMRADLARYVARHKHLLKPADVDKPASPPPS